MVELRDWGNNIVVLIGHLLFKFFQRFGIFNRIGQLPMTIRAGAITSCLCPTNVEDDHQNAQPLIDSSDNTPEMDDPTRNSVGSSTSSKHTSHTLEQCNTKSYDLGAVNSRRNSLRKEPPRKKFKLNKDKSETKNTSTECQQCDFTGNTVNDDELNLLTQLFENDPIDIEDLRLKLIELMINIPKLPADHDFLTNQNMFISQDVTLPINMKSMSTYQLAENSTLTIGTVIPSQLGNISNGIISLENAKEYDLYEGVIDEFGKHFNINKIYFISVDMNIFVFIESNIFPYWRWRSSMDLSYPMEWRNGCRIHKPTEKNSIIWNLEKHYIRTYQCKSLSETRHFQKTLERVTPLLNNVQSMLKMVDVIQQTKLMISNFIFIYQQPQSRYKDLELTQMNEKISANLKRMKNQATDDYKKIMHDLECDEREPNDNFIFVKYRRVNDRVRPQVLIELDFNKFL